MSRKLDKTARSSDAGLSLVEMLVAMMLSGIVLAMVGTLFVSVAKGTTDSNHTRDAATVAGNIANEVSKTIRFAVQNRVEGQTALDPAIVEGSATTLTLLSLADTDASAPAPARVRFSLQGQQLVQERWNAAASGDFWVFNPAVVVPERDLGGSLVAADGGDPALFSYFDANGLELLPGSTGLTSDQRRQVASVGFSISVRSPSSPDAPVAVVENVVGMPNLTYSGEEP